MKTEEKGGSEFGSVVVIFDEDEHLVKYPFQMTWLGEHSQESDMAFYSTLPGVEMVGDFETLLAYRRTVLLSIHSDIINCGCMPVGVNLDHASIKISVSGAQPSCVAARN